MCVAFSSLPQYTLVLYVYARLSCSSMGDIWHGLKLCTLKPPKSTVTAVLLLLLLLLLLLFERHNVLLLESQLHHFMIKAMLFHVCGCIATRSNGPLERYTVINLLFRVLVSNQLRIS